MKLLSLLFLVSLTLSDGFSVANPRTNNNALHRSHQSITRLQVATGFSDDPLEDEAMFLMAHAKSCLGEDELCSIDETLALLEDMQGIPSKYRPNEMMSLASQLQAQLGELGATVTLTPTTSSSTVPSKSLALMGASGLILVLLVALFSAGFSN